MAYRQIREILKSIRTFHRQLRLDLEQAYPSATDPRAKFLMRSIRRSEQQMDFALAKYEKQGNASVLDTWIQYVPVEDVESVVRSGQLPPHSSPDAVLEWIVKFDAALADFYRQLGDQVSAPRAKELLESQATAIEQRLSDQTWQAREEELAPGADDE